jgi:hypothetical protein
MRITIIHTPADVKSSGLLDDLRLILERGAVEVRTFLSEGTREAANGQAFAPALRDHFIAWSPDAIVLSDRLNGSKHAARRLARERGIGVLTIKESVFAGRAYFAPDHTLAPGTLQNQPLKPLENFERFRLAQFLAADKAIGCNQKLYKRLARIKPVMLVVDHSSQDDSWPEDWYISAADAINAAGRAALVCYRQRDLCGSDACEQIMLLVDGATIEQIPCSEICVDRAVRASRCLVTNGSILGLKALHMRKPVFLVGECMYSGMGFTKDIPYGENFSAALRAALETADFTQTPRGYERFLYNFIFRDLLPLEEDCTRFAERAEGQVIEALFRALPIERGARVLAGG